MWRFSLCHITGGANANGIRRHHQRHPGRLLFLMIAVVLQAQFIYTPTADAQSIVSLAGGVIDAESGSPVPGALISLGGTGFTVTTTGDGEFHLDHIPDGSYTVEVSARGYYPREYEIKIVADITRRLDIYMVRRDFIIEGITVESDRIRNESDRVAVIDRADITQSHAVNLIDLLESVEGVNIRRTGIGDGKVQISIRGGAAKHVLVLLDGQRLNSSGGGEVDLGTIPMDVVERIEIYRGGASAEFGSDALAGAINIITHPGSTGMTAREVQLQQRSGSWDARYYGVTVDDILSNSRLHARAAVTRRESKNDFPFTYTVYPADTVVTGVRLNSQTDATAYFLTGRIQTSQEGIIKFSGQFFESENGMPGKATEPNLFAGRGDKRKSLTVSYEQSISAQLRWETHLGITRFDQQFTDLRSAPAERLDSKYVDDILNFKAAASFRPNNRFYFRAGAQHQRELLDHSDYLRPTWSMGETRRTGTAVHLSADRQFDLGRVPGLALGGIDAAVRFDRTHTDKKPTSLLDQTEGHRAKHWSPRVGAFVKSSGRVSGILRISYGKSFRLPSINSLFWKGDARSRGNPGLKPELSEHSEGGLEISGEAGLLRFEGGITYFHSFVRDLIVWRQGFQGVWSPQNLDAARLTGHEDFVRLTAFEKRLTLEYQNTITTSRNRSGDHVTLNKELTFTPHYSTSWKATLNAHNIFASYSVRAVGKRYALENNQKYYDSYEIHDGSIGVELPFQEVWRLAVDYKLNNLTDEAYVLISQYPMPGRHWQIGARLTYEPTR